MKHASCIVASPRVLSSAALISLSTFVLLAPNLITVCCTLNWSVRSQRPMKPKTIKIQASGTLLEGDAQEKAA